MKYFLPISSSNLLWKHLVTASYEYESQLYEKDTHEPINISHFGGWKVDKVEAWYEKHWNNEDYDYYERWDEC